MARMSIDDSVTRDARVLVLAKLTGWNRYETLGHLLDVWAACYDRVTPYLSEMIVDASACFDGFAKHMVTAELACFTDDGMVRISGVEARIGYLSDKAKAGRKGGIKSGESRRNLLQAESKQTSSKQEAPANPIPIPIVPDPVPASVPPPVEDRDQSEKNSAAPSAGGSRSRRPKPSEPTGDERTSALFVLRKLTDRSGVRYSGTTEHVRLIVAQFRNGVTEADLRKVIGYCAVELEWEDNPDMAKYLRPETLFGPKTISKYLDAARDWFVKQGLELEPRPLLEVVQ